MGKNRIFGMIGFVALLGIGARMADAEPLTLAVSPPSAVRMIEQSVEIPTTTQAPTTTTVVTTTTTTVPEVPVTVTALLDETPVVLPYKHGADKMCWEWLTLAHDVGWPEDELSKLGYIIWRESRCDPMAWNQDDPTPDGSRGLTQINGFWCRPSRYHADGYIQTVAPELLAFSGTCEDLHDPAINFRAALLLYKYGLERGNNPWTPWGG